MTPEVARVKTLGLAQEPAEGPPSAFYEFDVSVRMPPRCRMPSSPMLRLALISPLCLLALGCGSASSETGEDVTTAPETSGEEGTETGGETTGGAPVEQFARGLTITEFRANQGVAVPLWAGGAEVGGNERLTSLQQGRSTLFRANYTVAADWVPREIKAVLHIVGPDGMEAIADVTEMVEGDANMTRLSGSLFWVIPAELALPGTRYYAEYLEVDQAFIDMPAAAEPPRVPAVDSSEIGFEGGEAVLEVVIVPVHHYAGDSSCDALTVLPEGYEDSIRSGVLARYPVSDVSVSVGAPMDVTGGVSAALGAVDARKMADGADESVVYMAVVDLCNEGTSGLTCSGNGGGRRFSALLQDTLGRNMETSEFCFTLALGGEQVSCPGNPQNNPGYPNVDGLIEDYGFDAQTFDLHRPESTYATTSQCNPGWISRYNWNRIFGTI